MLAFNDYYNSNLVSTKAMGSCKAKLLLISDFPNINDHFARRPISGGSWKLLDYFLKKYGIMKSDVRIESLWPEKVKGQDLKNVPSEELFLAIQALKERISKMENLIVIVPFGNYSVFALTGKGKVNASLRNIVEVGTISISDAEKKADITVLRGSIYTFQDANNRTIKVIPVLHPKEVVKFPKWGKRSEFDWKKIKREMGYKEHFETPRTHIIDPSEWNVKQFIKEVENNQYEALSCDIETWGNKLSCVGFAPNEYFSITIPTITKQQSNTFLPYIKQLSGMGTPKIFCNGLYDTYWFAYCDIPINNWIWDVQYMHHCLDPIESHSLDFLASIYSTANYWKDEAKDADEVLKYSKDLDALWTYNGIDCCVTYEVWKNLLQVLNTENCLGTYFQLYVTAFEPLLRMSRYGVRINRTAQNAWRKEIEMQQKDLRNELEEFAGINLFATEKKMKLREPTQEEWDLLLPEELKPEDFNENGVPKAKFINRENKDKLKEKGLTYNMSGKKAGKISYKVEIDKKDFSKEKLMWLFHKKLGLPEQFKRRKGTGKKTQSLDEGSIRKLIQKFPGKAGRIGNLLLTFREIGREHIYLRGGYDKDGRLRASFRPMTEAGRLKSAKNPRGTGFNLQNLKR